MAAVHHKVITQPLLGKTDKILVQKECEKLTSTQRSSLLRWLPFGSRSDKLAVHAEWMQSSGKTCTKGVNGKALRTNIPLEEVKLHCKADDAWVILKDKVYDITPYLAFHPGGAAILLKVAGTDALPMFNKYHPWVNFESVLAGYLVGTVAPRDKLAEYEARYKKSSKFCL